MSLRSYIVDVFKKEGKPVPLSEIAVRRNTTLADIQRDTQTTAPLSHVTGLTHDDVITLIQFYGEGLLFDSAIERIARGLQDTRNKIEKFESQANKRRPRQ